MPSRRLRQLRESAADRHQRRRRVCRGGLRARQRPRAPPRRHGVSGCRSVAVRRPHGLQRAPARRRATRIGGRDPGYRRTGPPRHPVCRDPRIRGRRDRARQRKATLAEQLGADHYIDSVAADPADVLRGLGGAAAIVATASNGASMSPLVAGLAPQGRLIVVGAGPEPLETQTADLIFGTRSIVGSLTGTSIENEDNLRLAQRRGIRSMNEIMPLSEAPKAYERMLSGQARFRIVLDTGSLANP